ncbi:MAG: ImmA/IrrE family metallo-endopeptidase [Spirochaetaceae bacterium]|jgi:Zn-dependent peptidase ImmA (M78 family)|nr:ImmA/IrrE family metallo-endopeptidase [Spirochaetaceae bacterium]
MTQAIPVNNDILKWARETSGLSITDVASKLKKAPDVIESWEQGILSPTYPQLEKLAYHIYKRPVAVFFFPVIPEESSPRAEFRTLPNEAVDAMPSEIIKVYRRAKVYQLNLEELNNNNDTNIPLLLNKFELTAASNVKILTKELRSFLKINLQIQKSWKNLDEAIKAWRNALTSYGIYVFKDAFHNDQYSGLSLYDKNYPIIMINNSMSKSRQIFTIFHELGHLLFRDGGVDILTESFYNRFHSHYYAIEQKCNEFAGEFLLPQAVFQANCSVFSEENLSRLADTFKVSREVVLRKYLDSNLITPEVYRSYTTKWLKDYLDSRKGKNNRESSGNHYNTKMSYLGMQYINLAFSHYYQGKIDMETLASYLGEKVGNVSTFEEYALKQS